VEAELQELEEAEAKEYLQSLGVQEGGLRSLINATNKQLGLLTYFTTGAWFSASYTCLLRLQAGSNMTWSAEHCAHVMLPVQVP
jgi:ribosome-binding ATPase YchF (GTP1/OBG family)